MNVEFKEKRVSEELDKAIYVGGAEVGWVGLTDVGEKRMYHARVSVPNGGTNNFIQGFGDTCESAFSNAIDRAKKDTQRFLVALDIFEINLKGEKDVRG